MLVWTCGFRSDVWDNSLAQIELPTRPSVLLRHRPRYVLASSSMEAPEMPSARLRGKVAREDVARRSGSLAARLAAAGIICNAGEGELIAA